MHRSARGKKTAYLKLTSLLAHTWYNLFKTRLITANSPVARILKSWQLMCLQTTDEFTFVSPILTFLFHVSSHTHTACLWPDRWRWRWSYRRECCQASNPSSRLCFNVCKCGTAGIFNFQDNFQPRFWWQNVFFAKTWYFPDPNQVFFVTKPNQSIGITHLWISFAYPLLIPAVVGRWRRGYCETFLFCRMVEIH